MKIITLKRLTEGGKPLVDDELTQCDPSDWFCVIETQEEDMVYGLFLEQKGEKEPDHYVIIPLWNDMVKHAGLGTGLSWGDDDVYGYLHPDEMPPEVGDEYTDGDGDRWVRIS